MSSLGVETAEDTVRYITLSLCFGFSFSGKVCDVGGDEYFFESEGKSSLIVFTDVTGASRTGRPGPGPVAVARPKAGRRAGVTSRPEGTNASLEIGVGRMSAESTVGGRFLAEDCGGPSRYY